MLLQIYCIIILIQPSRLSVFYIFVQIFSIMQRKSIRINGMEISYLESNPSLSHKTLLFVHGNSMSVGLFEYLSPNQIFLNYRMIALDLPGHGESAKSQNPVNDYRFNALKKTIASFVHQLDIKELVLAGHSLGGHLCIQLIPRLKESVKGLVIFGTPPLGSLADGNDAFLPSVALQYAYKGELSEDELKQFIVALGNGEHIQAISAAIKQCDPDFRPTLGMSLASDQFENETDILSRFKPGTLILHGEKDHLINREYLERLQAGLPHNNTTQIIPGAGHMSFLDKPEHFSRMIHEYLIKIGF